MLINQYACVSLTHDYQKKGDNPEALEKWQILNKEQQTQHKLPPVSEVIIGPGVLQKVQTPSTSQLITSIGDILFIAQAKQLQIFDRVSDLLSKEHSSQARPSKVLSFETILALLSTQEYLIIIMQKEVSINKWTQNSLKNVSSIVTPSPVLQSNLQKLKLFLCLQNSWITINLEDLKQETGKHNYIRAFLSEDKGIIGVMKDTLFVQNKYQIDTTKFISINYIFAVNTYVCICGSTGIEDDDDDPIYSGVIIWYQLGKIVSQIDDIEYHIDSKKDGDYNFQLLDDIVMIYGSNLQKSLFFKSGKQISKYKDGEDYLQFIVAQQEEIRGVTCMQLGKSLVLAVNQKIKHIARNPTIITLDKKGQLTQYEFLNFVDGMQEVIIEKQEPNLIKLNSNCFIGKQYKIQIRQNGQMGLVENLERDLDKLKSNPFFLEIDKSKLVKGSGVVNYAIQSHLKNPSGNLLIDYEGYQIIGSMNQMIVMTLLDIENMLQEKPINPIKIDISENLSEYILYFNKINDYLIVGTTLFCYLIKLNQYQITHKSILMKVEQLKKIDVIESYFMIQDGNQAILSILENTTHKKITQQQADSACLYQENDHLHLLILNQQQLYICSDMQTVERIQIDFQIQKSDNYFIHQLYRSKIYVAYAQIQNYELAQFIFDIQSRQSINQFNSLFSRVNINDCLINMESMDWSIIRIAIENLYFVAIFPNFAQEGYIFQGIDDSLFPLTDENQEIIQLPCYSNIVRGMSVLNFILPNETNIGPQPGLGYAIHDAVKYPLKFYPNILYMEHDEESNLTIHRYIMLKLTLSLNEEPCLKQLKIDQSLQQQRTLQPQQQQQQQLATGATLTRLDQKINLITKFCQDYQEMIQGTYENSFEAKMQLFVKQSCLDQLETTAAKLVQSYQQSSQLKQSVAQIDFHRLMKTYGGMFENIFLKQSNTQLREKVALVENTLVFYDKYVNHFLESIPLKNPQQIDQIIQYFEQRKPMKQKKSRKIAFTDEDSNDGSLGSYVQSLKFAPKQEVKYIRIPIKNRKIVIEQNDFDLSNIVFNHDQRQPPSFSESQNKFIQRLEKKEDVTPALPRSVKSNNLSDLQPKGLFQNSFAKDPSQVSSGELQEGFKTVGRPQSQEPVSFGQGFQLNFSKPPEEPRTEQMNKKKITNQQQLPAEPVRTEQSQLIFGNQFPSNQNQTENQFRRITAPAVGAIDQSQDFKLCDSESDSSENQLNLNQATIQTKTEVTKKDNKIKTAQAPQQQTLLSSTQAPSSQQPIIASTQPTASQQNPLFPKASAPPQQPIFIFGSTQASAPPQQSILGTTQASAPPQQSVLGTTQASAPPQQSVLGTTQASAPPQQSVLGTTQATAPQQQSILGTNQAAAPQQGSNNFIFGTQQSLFGATQKEQDQQKQQSQTPPPVTEQPQLKNQISFLQSNQPLQFGSNFLQGNQSMQLSQQQQQSGFSGLAQIGVSQNLNNNNANLNQSSFGQTASIFSSTAPKPQQPIQQIQFGLGQQQPQNSSIGGIFGQTGQSSFMDQSNKLNLNFSDQVNQPRK